MHQILFENFKDKGKKDKMLSMRVSSKMKEQFTKHANGWYGDTQKALEHIVGDYMEQIAFKRGNMNKFSNVIFLPIVDSMEDLESYYGRQIPVESTDYNNDMNFYRGSTLKNQIVNYSGTIYEEDYVNEYGVMPEYYEDDLSKYQHFLDKEWGGDSLDSYIVTNNTLNNHLDGFYKGSYSTNEFTNKAHRGLSIFILYGVIYYVNTLLSLGEEYEWQCSSTAFLCSNEDAYNYAMEVGNIELAKLIDELNDSTSNIKNNIEELIEKRNKLQRRVNDINLEIANLKKIE